VGEGPGAASGDAVLADKPVQAAQGMIDALSGLEVLGVPEEDVGDVGSFVLLLFGMMIGAEAGLWIENGETALATRSSAIGTTSGENGWFNGLEFHFGPRF
jgi:hypothetical protein